MGTLRMPALVLIAAAITGWAADGHFKEIDGTAAVEAESYWEKSSSVVISNGSVGGSPSPASGGAMFITCEGRTSSWAKWKVDFAGTGKYKVYILGAGKGLGGNNFNLFLGKAPNTLRSLNSSQNCTIANKASCPDYEANVSNDNTLKWLGYGDGQGNNGFYQCISSRGCKSYTDVGMWVINTPGTYYFGIHTGDEPFASHDKACSATHDPSILIDKFVFTKGSKPSGAGPAAVLSDGTPIDPGTDPGPDPTPSGDPAKVSGLQAVTVTATSIELAWNASANTTQYRVYWKPPFNNDNPDATTNQTTYTIAGLTAATRYQIWVKAYNGSTGAPGTSIDVTTPASGTGPSTGDCPTTAGNVLLKAVEFPTLSVAGFVPYYIDGDRLAIDAAQYKDKWAAARTTFSGATFVYDVKITTLRESDGESSYKLHVAGQQIGDAFQNPAGSDGQTATYTWQGVDIRQGSSIQVSSNTHSNQKVPEGSGFGYARGRWRQVEFIAKGPSQNCSTTIGTARAVRRGAVSIHVKAGVVTAPHRLAGARFRVVSLDGRTVVRAHLDNDAAFSLPPQRAGTYLLEVEGATVTHRYTVCR